MGFYKRITAIFRYINRHPLAGRHRARAYFNFFRWQLKSRLSTGPHRVPFVGGTVLMADKTMKGATGNIYLGLHDFSEMSFLLHFLRISDNFMDVGANIGSYSVLAAGVSRARCWAFEPVPQTFKFLERNIHENNLQALVSCINSGVGGKEETLYFTNLYDSVNHVVPEESVTDVTKVVKVPIVLLDSFASEIQNPLLIKIDVEGFETEVLKGMGTLLKSLHLKGIIIELNGSGNRYGYNDNDIHTLLLQNGFEPYSYEPYSRNIEKQNTFGNFNTIYLRDINFVKERLSEAPAIKIYSEEF